MKISCNIIGDLLPLYIEEQVSEESKFMIEEHLKECETCRLFLENMQETFLEDNLSELAKNKSAINPFKKLKSSIKKTIVLILVISTVGCTASVGGVLYSVGGWKQIGRVIGINHSQIISNNLYTQQLKKMIAEKEKWDIKKIKMDSPAQECSWRTKNNWTFVREISYEGKQYICMIYAEETFIGRYDLTAYEFAQVDPITKEVKYSNGSFTLGD